MILWIVQLLMRFQTFYFLLVVNVCILICKYYVSTDHNSSQVEPQSSWASVAEFAVAKLAVVEFAVVEFGVAEFAEVEFAVTEFVVAEFPVLEFVIEVFAVVEFMEVELAIAE